MVNEQKEHKDYCYGRQEESVLAHDLTILLAV